VSLVLGGASLSVATPPPVRHGRAVMIAYLEELHEELFQVWRIASGLTAAMAELMTKLQKYPPIKH
jgi:hypothetical protein